MPVRRWQIIGLLTAAAMFAARCGTGPTATSPPSATPAPVGLGQIILLADNSLGGLSSSTKTTTIDARAGTFVIEKTGDDPLAGALAEEDLEALEKLVIETDFFSFEENYIPDDGTCCDLIAYTITVTQDGQTHNVRASDSNMPEGFRALLGRIQALTEG